MLRWMGSGFGVLVQALAIAGLPAAGLGAQHTIDASAEVWIRESAPDDTHENDLISVWSSASTDGARRYGLVRFDLSPLAGQSIESAQLRLYSLTGGSQAQLPLKQRAYVVDSAGTSLTSLTWNSYMAEKDAGKQALEGLGRYELPSVASMPALQNAYVDSQATAADLAMLQAAADGSGMLTLVLIADEDGSDYRRDWGDGENGGQKPRLVITSTEPGNGCTLAVEPLPPATQGVAYSAPVAVLVDCPGQQVQLVECPLPPNLRLDPVTGIISGTTRYAGVFPLTLQRLDGQTVVETREIELVVNGVYNARADLDGDGDVDLEDLDPLAIDFTGPRPESPACELQTLPEDVVELAAVGDVWIRELMPDVTYESDLISIWSSANTGEDAGKRRYGLIEFDLSPLAGQPIAAATLSLWVADTFSGVDYPLKQKAYIIDSAGTPLTQLTWNTFHAQKDATRLPLATLGAFDQGVPKTTGIAGTYQDSHASLADLALLTAEANGDGKLSLVFIADEDGTQYRGDWGDSDNAGGPGYTDYPAKLRVILGSPCYLTGGTLPDGEVGQIYAVDLSRSEACSDSLHWQVVGCELPPGLTLISTTGQVHGRPQFAGAYPFRVRLTDTVLGVSREADFSLNIKSSRSDLDDDGDVDRDDLALMQAAFTGPLDPDFDLCWRRYVKRCLDTLIEYGTDRYGPVHTPMLMSILNVNTLESPENPPLLDADVRTEGRPNHGRRSPGGSNLWADMPTLRVMYRLSEVSGDPMYAQAADAYITAVFQRAVKTNPGHEGTLVWGSHSYYHAFNDAPGGDHYGDGSPVHEILINHPLWDQMFRVNPAATQTAVDMIWQWHIHDKVNGRHNRHDDGSPGLDFAFSGGSFILAFAAMYAETGDPAYLDKARLIANWHWQHRHPTTGLLPDAPSTTRYDGTHSFTSVTGPFAAQLLAAYQASGDTLFRDQAISYIKTYDQYAWDEELQTYYAMIELDGTPVPQQPKGGGYDAWAPTGTVDVWRTVMYSYEFAVEAAEAAVYAYELSGVDAVSRDPQLLVIALRWAKVIEAALPPHTGRRWKTELEAAMPNVLATGGTYAENYGRAISFFVNLAHATGDEKHLRLARRLGREAVARLFVNGLFRGHPAKDYYQANDGVGYLLHALMQLDAWPQKWRLAF